MKAKREVYNFVAGKYITGDVFNMFEEKIAKKIKSSFSRIKSKGGYNKKHDIYYFIGKSFVDYIDKDICLDINTALAIIPETLAKEGKLKNCKRFTAKSNFNVTYIEDKLGSALYFKYPDDPSPFMMLVNDIEA